jgi:predicted DNA-binding WGR domain protein
VDWEKPLPGFRFVLFEMTEREINRHRFYYLAWQRTLLDAGAVVRIWGRKGGHQRHLSPQPFASLEDAWPLLRAIIKTRLRHGYRVALPKRFAIP